MDGRKAFKGKILLTSGGFTCEAGPGPEQNLMFLQMLLRLKKMGFDLLGNHVYICRVLVSEEIEEKIQSRAGTGKNMHLLSVEEAGEKQVKSRFGKKRLIRFREVTIAAGGDSLFFLIDAGAEKFEILPPCQAAQAVERAYKEGPSKQKTG